jgi:hypothetical protein
MATFAAPVPVSTAVTGVATEHTFAVAAAYQVLFALTAAVSGADTLTVDILARVDGTNNEVLWSHTFDSSSSATDAVLTPVLPITDTSATIRSTATTAGTIDWCFQVVSVIDLAAA